MRRQATDWEKICAKDTFDKKKIIIQNIKRTLKTQQKKSNFKNGQKTP